MKFTIEKEKGITRIFDGKGNKIYWEDSDGYWRKSEFDGKGNNMYWEDSNGYWVKSKFDNKGNEIYWEDSTGYWRKRKFDSRGNEIYWEDSDGKKWGIDIPKKTTISAKDLDSCLKKLKEVRPCLK